MGGAGGKLFAGRRQREAKTAPRDAHSEACWGDSNTATFSSVRQILCSARRPSSRIFRCRSCIVRILDRCARVRATRFRAIGFLNRKTFCGFHKLSPKQQFFRPKNASEKKGYVPRRYIPLCLRITCFAFVHLVLRLCIRLRVWDKEAAAICAPPHPALRAIFPSGEGVGVRFPVHPALRRGGPARRTRPAPAHPGRCGTSRTAGSCAF